MSIWPVKVHVEKRFVAAYSTRPFWERFGILKKQYPDYVFDYDKGIYWCYRVGTMSFPWGIACQEGLYNFHASGVVVAERRDMRADSFDRAGLPFQKEGDVYYLYDFTEENGGFNTEQMYVLNDRIRRLAVESGDPIAFLKNSDCLKDDPVIQSWFAEHYLKFKLLLINNIGSGTSQPLATTDRPTTTTFLF